MKLLRRSFLHLAAGAAALPALSHIARAQAYPVRPVRVIEGFGAGSTPDIIARLMGQWLSEKLGKVFIVENRSGATSNLATEAVVKAPADGHTLLLVTVANSINATFFAKLNYNFMRDVAPVAGITRVPFVMEVHPSVPARTVPEFIAYAKANQGRVNLGSAGTGTLTHISGELFNMMTGANLVHVPYRGAQVLVGMVAGQAQVYFGPITASIEHIRAGKLRALAVTTAVRLALLPDIPTLAEFLPGYEASGWYGIGTPKNTPAAIIDKLNHEVNTALVDPNFRARLADLGGDVLAGSPADFGKLIADETEKWANVIKFAGIKAE